MSQLTTKSDINFAAAEELQKKSYYCSSIHCSYYSCIQLMLHLIHYITGVSQENLSKEFKLYKKANPESKGGLHEYYINLVKNQLRVSGLDAHTFNKEIFILKQKRTEADYLDMSIGPDDCRFSIQRAETINKIIRKAI